MAYTGNLLVTKQGDDYDVSISSDMTPGEAEEIKGVTPKDNALNFDYTTKTKGMSVQINMNLDFRERRMEGIMTAGTFGSFPVKGSRK